MIYRDATLNSLRIHSKIHVLRGVCNYQQVTMKELLTATLTAPTTLSCLVSGLRSLLSVSLQLASIWTPTKYAVWNQNINKENRAKSESLFLSPNHNQFESCSYLAWSITNWRYMKKIPERALIFSVTDQNHKMIRRKKTKQTRTLSLSQNVLKEYKSSTCNLIFALCMVSPLECIPSSKPTKKKRKHIKLPIIWK